MVQKENAADGATAAPAEAKRPSSNGNGGSVSVHAPTAPAPTHAAADGIAKLQTVLANAKAGQEKYATFTQEQVRFVAVEGMVLRMVAAPGSGLFLGFGTVQHHLRSGRAW